MPIVRSLRNRVSFEVDPASKANAEKTFMNIKSAAGKVLKGIVAITAAGATMFAEAESNKATVRFFSRTNEEAEKLLQVVKEIRGEGIISERERLQAAAILSQLVPDIDAYKDVLSILKDISIAQPKLDFPGSVQIFADFVKTGDIDSLRQLGAVGKDLAEQLTIANVSIEDSVKGQANRAQLLTQELEKQKERIRELAIDQKNTLTFAFRGLSKEVSDFTLNFGEKTAPEIKELVGTIRDMVKELNASEGFWNTVRVSVDSINKMIGSFSLAGRGVKALFTGDFEELRKLRQENLKSLGLTKDPLDVFPETAKSVDQGIVGKVKNLADQEGFLGAVGGFIKDNFVEKKRPTIEDMAPEIKPFFNPAKTETNNTLEIMVGGTVTVEGKNLQGADMSGLGSQIQESIIGQFKEANRNIIAKSGGSTGIGGAP